MDLLSLFSGLAVLGQVDLGIGANLDVRRRPAPDNLRFDSDEEAHIIQREWTVFPIVFVLAPTGLGLIGAAVANLLYLVLDIYTKIVFNIQLGRTS